MIEVTSATATYLRNSCGDKRTGGMTDLLGSLGNDLATCNPTVDQLTLTPDPCYGQVNSFEATCNCGSGNKTRSGAENSTVTFSCP